MNTESLKQFSSWMPFTFRGVAAFSRRSGGQVLGVAFLVACAVAAGVVWFAQQVWVPAVASAVDQLPEQGEIRHGRLEWTNAAPAFLAEGRLFAILVDAEATEGGSRVADVQLEFHREDLRICTPFGFYALAYPSNYVIGLNRSDAAPAWGAWRPAILAGLALGVGLVMLVSWLALSLAATLPLRLLAYLTDREAPVASCWRLAMLALMPGALLMTIAMVLYGAEAINLTDLLVAWPLHLVVGLVYAVGGMLCLPWAKPPLTKAGNPFSSSRSAPPAAGGDSSPPAR